MMSQTIRHRFISWMSPETDASLLQRYIARQDQAAFSLLVRRYLKLIQSVCHKELASVVDVEDACQSTFLILAQRASSIRNQDALRSWLHGVAIRVSKAMKRRAIRLEKRHRELSVSQLVGSAAEILADNDLQALLRREVEGLPEQYRVPLQLCYWHGQSREEVAATLGWTKGQVKGQLERAKRRLKARLTQRGVQLMLPVGLGLTTVALVTIVPTIATAATTTASAASLTGWAMQIGSVFCRIFQATKGIAMLGLAAVGLGVVPPFPILPIFPDNEQQQVSPQVETENDVYDECE
jgi:RNA polymerase sigma factor (sigma-70 family)